MKKSLLFVVGAVAALLLPAIVRAQTPKSGNATAGNAETGKRLYGKIGCYECHGYAGQGGSAGARIAATSLPVSALIRYVRRPSGAMPAYTEKVLSDLELTDIYAYLKSLPVAKPGKDIPLLNKSRDK